MPTPANNTSPFQADEDFINKSLLASLDADAEPLSSPNEAEHIVSVSYRSNSNSSTSGSPSINFPMHHQHSTRPDSPSDAQTVKQIHRDSFYVTQGHGGLYTSTDGFHRHSEFQDEYDSFANNSYRNSFTSYPNTTRSRQQAALNPSYRDHTQFYPPVDMYPDHPGQSHVPPSAYDSHNPFDFANGQSASVHKSYHADQFGQTSTPSLFHNHGKQQPLSNYQSAVPQVNGIQFSSQTPYGPHLPTNATLGLNTANSNTGGVPPNLPGPVNGTTAAGEEISTIFVVGFPEDMQVCKHLLTVVYFF
jgi:hypothetical protein